MEAGVDDPRVEKSESNVEEIGFKEDGRGWSSNGHTSYLSPKPREFSCKFFFAGVIFYRFFYRKRQISGLAKVKEFDGLPV